MRLVKVTVPDGQAAAVAQIAFDVGIRQVAVHREQTLRANQVKENKEVVDVAVSTPEAKSFLDALMAAPFFDTAEYSINVRQPRSIVSSENPAQITWPVVEPSVDLYEELWQFSHVTYSFVGRVFIAGLLVAYGLIDDKILFIIAGLLFIPFLPPLLGVAFGLRTRESRLALRGALAFGVGVVLLFGAGALVAALTGRPLAFHESTPLLASFLISLLIGTGATLAVADDVGKREIIGLAASAQLGIIPVWLGVAAARGYPAVNSPQFSERLLSLLVNAATITGVALLTFAALRVRGEGIRRLKAGTSGKAKG